ncbi:MAG: rhombosortase [bacterium]
MLRYERIPLENGQWWRLLTGNLIHLGWSHALLNAAGLLMVWSFFGKDYSVPEWLALFLISALGVTLGLYTMNPHVIWYVGLSGLLHGLFIAGAIRVIKDEPVFASLMLLSFAGKLTYEQFIGPLPGTSDMAGGPVLVDAHLYGAITGGIVGTLVTLWHLNRLSPSATKPDL